MNQDQGTETPLVLHLTGGLGNQLFQVAAGLYASGTTPISVEWVLGKPRLNSMNFPQIECYQLPPEICFLERSQESWLAGKTLGYLLRSSIDPNGVEKLPIFRFLTRRIGSLVLLMKFGKFKSITTGNNLGYSPLGINNKKRYLLGYFQSFKYSDDEAVIEILRNLKVKNFESYSEYERLAQIEEPLVVHVRLSDYLKEDKFGIPEFQYYENSITVMWNSGAYKKIWLFSDDPENAQLRIPNNLQSFVRSFGDVEDCIVKTLEVMRLGKGYVIANSSFSWWGARLSKAQQPVVVAPDPWFRHLREPTDLIPITWLRKKAWI